MGRLIDADALIKTLETYKFGAIQNEVEREYIKETVINFVKDAPTAYEPEKVVEELDESSFLMEPRTEGHYADNGVFLDEAIKIVRKGGAT